MTHRYYDPHLARFLTRDPSGHAAALNLYAYAGNNPASYCDPDGHFVLLITGAIGAGVGAIIGGGIAWWNGDNIWVGAGKGFVLGGIAGLTGGLAGEAIAGWIGGTAIANGGHQRLCRRGSRRRRATRRGDDARVAELFQLVRGAGLRRARRGARGRRGAMG